MAFLLEEGVCESMSQAALLRLMKAFRQVLRNHRVSGWSRLGLLLMAAVFLSFWVAARHVDADMLFQSPVSPLAQPGFDPVSPLAPVEQVPVEQVPVEQAPVEQAPVEPTVPDQTGAVVAPEPPTPEPTPRRAREEAPVEEESGRSNFILDQAELIDTAVVSGAYIWLCCGVSLFLLVPLALLFVYIRGRSKIIKEEGY